MNYRKLLAVPKFFERFERRMKTKMSVEVQLRCCFYRVSESRLCDANRNIHYRCGAQPCLVPSTAPR